MKQILGWATGVLLSVLAADLLYLYYAGRWIEPILWMQAQEVVALYIIFFMGIAQAVLAIQNLRRDRYEQ